MSFKPLSWLYPQLPTITGTSWIPDWPQDLAGLPRASFKIADDSTGLTISGNDEGSAMVSYYTDTWSKTPEDREDLDATITETLIPLGLVRGMKRHITEIWADGTQAYRSTILWRGEYDHGTGRMCQP